jgi:hypothetical protein
MFERYPTHASAFEYSGRRMIRVRRMRGTPAGPNARALHDAAEVARQTRFTRVNFSPENKAIFFRPGGEE